MDKIAIYGAGGFGREVAWLIQEINRMRKQYEIIGFIDDDISLTGRYSNDYPVLGGFDFLEKNTGFSLAVAVGDPAKRIRLLNRLENLDFSYPNIIHPSVLIGDDVTIGIGNIICAGSIITVDIKIGNFCHLNLKTSVGHNCILEDFVTTACSVDFAGYSHVETGVYLGNHATVLSNVRIGAFSTLGAGAVANRDISPGVVAVGVPARKIRDSRHYHELKTEAFLQPYPSTSLDPIDERESGKRTRFAEWNYPDIENGKPTKYTWVVQHTENFMMGYKIDIGSFTYINAKNGVVIEDFVQIGSHCSIYSISTIDQKKGKVLLRRNCKIGSHSVIMPGVTIGENTIVGAFSFVNKNIPDNVIVVGSPARVIKKIEPVQEACLQQNYPPTPHELRRNKTKIIKS